ncbi:unnamed protein product [Caenorhabditis nigoni]
MFMNGNKIRLTWYDKKENDNDGDGSENSRELLENHEENIKNRIQRKIGQDDDGLYQRQIISPLSILTPFLDFH